MKRTWLTILLAGAMIFSLLTGCSKKNEEVVKAPAEVKNITLKVWCPQNQVDTGIMDQQQKAFAALHPEWNITWVTEIVGEDKAQDSVLNDVEAAADVFFFANDQLKMLMDAGAVARLGGDAEAMVNNEMASSVADTVKVNGAIYGIPFTHNTFFMYYDKTLLSEEDV
ncbi:MAG: extracellular solute-binding protein, partial [Candidatus Treponema excrementipullorum]|nr:extracellular solute-binding protein [Candidatus Treponema excrementipullorum]